MNVVTQNDPVERAKALLSASKIRDLCRLDVTQHGESIKLSGRVSTYYYMQLAQALIRGKLGCVVVNDMHVH